MPKLTFIEKDGNHKTVEAPCGLSVMELAHKFDVDIEGACEGSLACGASKWQTIRRIVLPHARPGILTGAILAMARGAGEVAPLMFVGAVKLAPELPIDGVFPFIHPERSFMHLGFHIYDLGFQSQNSEAAKPMVFTTTLLLISIIAPVLR